MTLESFEIVLRNEHKSYFAGQIVSGQVVVSLKDKAKLIHGIKLKLQGKAKTHWKESSGRSTSHFSKEEVYIDQKIYLIGYESDNSEMSLEEGRHEYNFSFTLPPSLPSSVSHKYGHVKYQLEATITRNRKSNYTSKVPFTVNGILDLNCEEEGKNVGEISNEKNVCCLFCASGPLGFDFKIMKKGYVPGEKIGFQCHLYNHSNRTVNLTNVSIVQELKFIADLEHSKTKTVQISEVEGPQVNCGDKIDWILTSDVSCLRVPSVPPSRLDGCRIINISYFIKVKMEAEGTTTLKEYLPIIIGTIPLRDDFGHISNCEASNSAEERGDLDLSLPAYPDLPPPSYEEALNGTKPEDTESTCSDPPDYGSIHCKSFIPKYALYRFYSK